ncbi:hypothetical protein BJX61DRAFT_483470 [Aspergillus egyptiacus]|nr:hypothetical protein BJX61DRAFT_483470 [Aspergillus egyptiacus]
MRGSRVSQFSPWSKLHPPLPRTPRQSQQLLNALTSSFRRELDRQHPTTASSSDQPQSSNSNNVSNSDPSTEEHPHSSAYAADKHLRTILENPLFRVVPPRPTPSSGTHRDETSRLSTEPMIVLDERIASGSATERVLSNCLRWQLLLISSHTGESYKKALRDSKAGSRVIPWWFASDTNSKIKLFQNDGLLSLCKFMVAERLHGTIFDWLKMLAKRDFEYDSGQITVHRARECFKRLLCYFLKAEADCGGGISSSIRYHSEACGMVFSLGEDVSDVCPKGLLARPAHYIWHLLQSSTITTKDVPSDLYEQYTTLLSMLVPRTLIAASMPLYHPTNPDATPFVRYVRDLPPETLKSWYFSPDERFHPRHERFLRSGFDALRIMFEDNENSADCVFLARLMQQHLEETREARATTESGYNVSSEEKALLSSLDLALA